MKKLMVCLAILFAVAGVARADFYSFGSSGAAYDLTDDGSSAVCIFYNGQVGLWTVDGGFEPIAMGDFNYTPSVAISGDGSTVAASLENAVTGLWEASKWTEAGGWELLGGLPGGGSSGDSLSSGWGINGDGSTIVGLGWQDAGTAVAMQWTGAGGAGLIQTPNGESSRASAVSADGSTIVGWYGGWDGPTFNDRRPTRWVDGGAEDVFMGQVNGEGTNTNSDGSIIVGQAWFDWNWNRTAFTYNDTDGVTDLGLLVPDIYGSATSIANDVSEDGIVVGWSGDEWAWDLAGLPVGAIWLPDGTKMSAHEYLELNGVIVELPPGGPMGDWRIRSVTSISDNGKILCGSLTNPMREFMGWYAVIPTPVYTMDVTWRGTVEYNQVQSGLFADVNPGDPVTVAFQVSTDDFIDSENYNVRGYNIIPGSFTQTMGSVTVGLADPFPAGETPRFMLRNNDPVSDGFFIESTNIDWAFDGLPLNEPGQIGEWFSSKQQVGYSDAIESLDIYDAIGVYDYTNLESFYTTVADGWADAIGLEFVELEIAQFFPFEVSIECTTPTLTLPDMGGFEVSVVNNTDELMQVQGALNVTNCYGNTWTNIRRGTTNLNGGETFSQNWAMNIPRYNSTCNCDLVWSLVGTDLATDSVMEDSCIITTDCDF